jgi:hypothetical protein
VDLAMPGTSGEEVAWRLRKEFPAAELTLGAQGYQKDWASSHDGLFEHHLLKPVAREHHTAACRPRVIAGKIGCQPPLGLPAYRSLAMPVSAR